MNQQLPNFSLPLDVTGNFLTLLGYLEKIAGVRKHFDQVRFVTSEDWETL